MRIFIVNVALILGVASGLCSCRPEPTPPAPIPVPRPNPPDSKPPVEREVSFSFTGSMSPAQNGWLEHLEEAPKGWEIVKKSTAITSYSERDGSDRMSCKPANTNRPPELNESLLTVKIRVFADNNSPSDTGYCDIAGIYKIRQMTQ